MRAKKENEKVSIVATKKDDNGIITDFKLSDGRIMNKEEAVVLAKTKGIEGIDAERTRGEHPHEILRSNPTNDVSKALNFLLLSN